MAPNSTASNNRSTLIEYRYLDGSSKSEASKCIVNNLQSKTLPKSTSHHGIDPYKKNSTKKTITKVKKQSGFSLFKPFECGQCRMRFIQMDQLQKHVRYHNQEMEINSSQTNPATTSQEKTIIAIRCCLPGCDKKFKTRKALGNHIRKVHPLG